MVPLPANTPIPPLPEAYRKDPLVSPQGLSCLFGSGATRLVSRNLAGVILAIGLGLITTALVMKFVNRYSKRAVVNLRQCVYSKQHVKITIAAAIVFALIGLSWLHVGMGLGFLLGCYSAVNLSVERNIRRLQIKQAAP